MFNPFENARLDEDEEDLLFDFSEIRDQWVRTPPLKYPSHQGGEKSNDRVTPSRQPKPTTPSPGDPVEPVKSPVSTGAESSSIQNGQGRGSNIVASSSIIGAGNQSKLDELQLEKPKKGGGLGGPTNRKSFERRRDARRTGPDGRGKKVGLGLGGRVEEEGQAKARKGGGTVGDQNQQQIAVGQTFNPNNFANPNSTAVSRAALLAGGGQAAVVKLVSTGGGRGSAAAQRVSQIGGLVNSIQDVYNMLYSDRSEEMSMAQQQVIEASLDRFQRTAAKISESLRGDPGLKEAFDQKIKPSIDGLKSFGEKSKTGDDLSNAVRSRTVEAQAIENAEALERQARASGDADQRNEKEGAARNNRSIAGRAGSKAQDAENALRGKGIETQPIAEAAQQVVRADEIRPDIESPESSPSVENDSPKQTPTRGKPKGRSR